MLQRLQRSVCQRFEVSSRSVGRRGSQHSDVRSLLVMAMSERTFTLWLTIATIIGTGVATFIAFMGGAAIVARQYRREREHRSALAILSALAQLDHFVPFLTANIWLEDDRPRDDAFAAMLERVGRDMRLALESIPREQGLGPDTLIDATQELHPVAAGLRDTAERLGIGYPDPEVRPADASMALSRRVRQIDEAVRNWLKTDVASWRRSLLRIPPWEPNELERVKRFMEALEATYVRGAGPGGVAKEEPDKTQSAGTSP